MYDGGREEGREERGCMMEGTREGGEVVCEGGKKGGRRERAAI